MPERKRHMRHNIIVAVVVCLAVSAAFTLTIARNSLFGSIPLQNWFNHQGWPDIQQIRSDNNAVNDIMPSSTRNNTRIIEACTRGFRDARTFLGQPPPDPTIAVNWNSYFNYAELAFQDCVLAASNNNPNLGHRSNNEMSAAEWAFRSLSLQLASAGVERP